SCAFPIPGSLANGTYEMRLMSNNGFSQIAGSNTFTVQTMKGPLSVSPNVTSPGVTVTVMWTDISTTSTDWIRLHLPASSSSAYLQWMYVSCSHSLHDAHQICSCAFPISGSLANGTYEMRLMSNDGFSQIAGSNTFNVQ